jgi:hypothetical protein
MRRTITWGPFAFSSIIIAFLEIVGDRTWECSKNGAIQVFKKESIIRKGRHA